MMVAIRASSLAACRSGLEPQADDAVAATAAPIVAPTATAEATAIPSPTPVPPRVRPVSGCTYLGADRFGDTQIELDTTLSVPVRRACPTGWKTTWCEVMTIEILDEGAPRPTPAPIRNLPPRGVPGATCHSRHLGRVDANRSRRARSWASKTRVLSVGSKARGRRGAAPSGGGKRATRTACAVRPQQAHTQRQSSSAQTAVPPPTAGRCRPAAQWRVAPLRASPSILRCSLALRQSPHHRPTVVPLGQVESVLFAKATLRYRTAHGVVSHRAQGRSPQ